jgi:hypothetical protein
VFVWAVSSVRGWCPEYSPELDILLLYLVKDKIWAMLLAFLWSPVNLFGVVLVPTEPFVFFKMSDSGAQIFRSDQVAREIDHTGQQASENSEHDRSSDNKIAPVQDRVGLTFERVSQYRNFVS